jgi:glyoxylase-like metal-dependent hydrolase (beta-lactamase superfamily II)
MMFDRRRFLTCAIGGLLAHAVEARKAGAAQATPAGTSNAVQPLGERLALVTSGGTNVLALSTPDGLVLVDSGTPDQVDALLATLRQLSGDGRVRTVFNTHFHPTNTGANEALRSGGAAIVAHENTRLWMATPVWVPAEDRYRTPRAPSARPTETFRVDGSQTRGTEQVDYGYLIEAHTSGDIYVRFREANVLAVGDVAAPARDPELDYFTGAWIGGRVDAMDRLLALCDDRTRIVPGLGPVMTKAQLAAERDMMKAVYDRTVDRVREGDDANDMLDAGVLSGLARTWIDPRRFLYDVQKGLWAHHNKLSPNVV